MGDALEEVLQRHREIWRERLWWAAVLCACFGVVVGYVVAKVFG